MPEAPSDFYVVIHVWTTCDEHGVCVSKDSAEVIEVAWILINAKTLEEVRREEVLIRPVNTPITSLCTSSTGLTWDHVQNAGSFREAIQRIDSFIKEHVLASSKTFTFVALDAWDLRVQIPREARDKAVALPPYLQHPKCFELRVEYSRWQQYHPEALPFGPSSLSNICAALEVEAGLQTSSSQSSLTHYASAHTQYSTPRRAMETADIISKALRALIKKSQPPENHPDVLTKPRDALADVHAFLNERSKVLHLSGLPNDTTQSELESWFTQHGGRPTTFWTLRTPDSHKMTGSGYAMFSSHEEAAESLGMNGRALGDRAIEVSPSSARVLERAAEILTPFPPSKNRPRPGDWTCPSCGFSNFQRRTACFRCSYPSSSAQGGQSDTSSVMYSFPPSLQSAPMSSYMSTASSQPSQSSRSTTMPGSVPFRAGDWKCGSEGCGYHNFAKNVSCLRCGASRAQAALIADSTGGLSTPASMSSMGSMYSTPAHHPSESLGSSIFNSSQFPPSQAYPAPLPSSNNMPSQTYPPLGGQSYGGPQGMNNMGGMNMGGGKGGPQMESGDWTCVSCGYVNFRRRNNCLRCNNFNPNLIAPGSAGMMGHPQSMMRGQPQHQQQHQHQQQPQHQLSMLDTSIIDSFLGEDDKSPHPHSRIPQSAGAVPSSSFLTRSMNNLSLGPLTSQYGSHSGGGGYGTIGGGPMTAPPGVSDDEYEYGSRSASAVDRLGSGGFFSHRPSQDD